MTTFLYQSKIYANVTNYNNSSPSRLTTNKIDYLDYADKASQNSFIENVCSEECVQPSNIIIYCSPTPTPTATPTPSSTPSSTPTPTASSTPTGG